MIGVGPSSGDFAIALARAPAAFVWWYIDLVDLSGNGAVLLWSFGLPFLPGAARPKDGLPLDRPALNLAVYEGGRAVFYLLQEMDPARCVWNGDHEWLLEESRIVRTDAHGRVRVQASLDLALPRGGRAQGALTLEGPLRHGGGSVRDARHSWEPISLGGTTGELLLDCGNERFAVRGRAYHDRNGGQVPLPAQGLRAWRWGRASLPDRDLVIYWLEDEAGQTQTLLFEADHEGRFTEHQVHETLFSDWHPGRLGGSWPARITLESTLGRVTFEQGIPLDDGPFYLRSPLTAFSRGQSGPGFSEHVQIDRLDLALHRPFVSMRVHRTRGPNSMWLPLFSGPRSGRVARLLGARA